MGSKRSPRPAWRRLVDRWRGARCRRRLLDSRDPEPSLAAPVGQAVTAAQFREPFYAHWCGVIRETPRLHRKQWEFVYVLRALESRGMLAPGRRGLGFGVGREPLVAAMAAAGCRILATDLEPTDPAVERWRESGEYGGARKTLNERGICPVPDFEDRVEFAHADMRSPSTNLGTFDFLWSSCALEHLGSLQAGLDFLRSSLERLAPGGVAVHTTEYNVSSEGRTVEQGPVVLYRRSDFRALAEDLRGKGFELELNFNTGQAPEDLQVDLPPYEASVHLKLLHERFATTSFGLLIHRKG